MIPVDDPVIAAKVARKVAGDFEDIADHLASEDAQLECLARASDFRDWADRVESRGEWLPE